MKKAAAFLKSKRFTDPVAISLAQAVEAANPKARELGYEPEDSAIFTSYELEPDGQVWNIAYGPKDYINRRGGGIMIYVDAVTGNIKRVLYSQ